MTNVDEDTVGIHTLVEVGRFAILTTLLSLIIIFLPIFSFLVLALCPIPTLIISLRRGLKYGLLTVLCSGLLILLLVRSVEAAALFSIVFVLGVGQSYAIGEKFSWSKMIALGSVTIILALVTMGFLTYLLTGINLVSQQTEAFGELIAKEEAFLKRESSEKETEAQLKIFEEGLKSLPYILPAAVVIFSLWVSLLNFLVSIQVLRRLKLEVPTLPAFKNWQLPWYFAWGYIIGLGGSLFYKYFGPNSNTIFWVGLNSLVIFGILFLVQGFSITFFFLEKYELSTAGKAAVLLLAMVVQLLFQGLTWLGLLDTWFNWRKLPQEA